MASYIEAETLVLNGPRYTTHLVVGFKYDYCGIALLQEFMSRSKTSGSGTDDYAAFSRD